MSITDSQIRLSDPTPHIRPTAVAGTFYPANVEELRGTITTMLKAAKVDGGAPKAIIVPHAGYIYSGSTAALAYASLRSIRQDIKRVILLGPAHRVYVQGMALPTDSAFATPLGNINIDRDAANQIKHLPQVHLFDDAHAQEHSLEVQLPFLQLSLDRFSLLPLVVGEATPEQVAEVLDLLWGGAETLIVISSDLSHFHDYVSSQRIDAATSDAIETLQFEQIASEQACGCRPMNGLLHIARQRGMQVNRLGLCNSGDTAGDRDRVVGYGAWSLHEKQMLDEEPLLDEEHRQLLLSIARQSIEQGFNTQQPLKVDINSYAAELCETRATFVTLKINNQLRGCIGTTEAIQPLVTSVAESAFNAAFRDPRFKPLSEDEYENIDLSISVLTPQQAISFQSENELLTLLRPGKDGLTIKSGQHKATFLPAVWESIPDAHNFLAQLKLKAGIKVDESVELAWRYAAESIS
jgi:MEMO1 family protein